MRYPATIVGLGEILWDNLPSVRTLGGAPANFAYMVNTLGDRGIVASRIGPDRSGDQILESMKKRGLPSSYLQRDKTYETGYSVVGLDAGGQASYRIAQPVAWDNLEWNTSWRELATQADAICFGTLAQRSETSARSIDSFLKAAPGKTLRIFDANLRAPYFDPSLIVRSLRHADVVKFNEQEVGLVAAQIGYSSHLNEKQISAKLIKDFDLRLVCITRGGRGSLLISREKTVNHPGRRVPIVDSIGAGDAFTACLVHHYIRGVPLEDISEVANRFAGWVATQAGATPAISKETLDSIFSARELCSHNG